MLTLFVATLVALPMLATLVVGSTGWAPAAPKAYHPLAGLTAHSLRTMLTIA